VGRGQQAAAEAVRVEQRDRAQDRVVGRQGDRVGVGARLGGELRMGARNALGPPGGPRRVLVDRDVVGQDGRRRRGVVLDQRLDAGDRAHRQPLDAGRPAFVGQDRRHAGIAEHELELGRLALRAQRHRDGAEPARAQERGGGRDAVGEQDRDGVAVADPAGREAAGEAVSLLAEVLAGDARVPKRERRHARPAPSRR
jgi:hypothetical protein